MNPEYLHQLATELLVASLLSVLAMALLATFFVVAARQHTHLMPRRNTHGAAASLAPRHRFDEESGHLGSIEGRWLPHRARPAVVPGKFSRWPLTRLWPRRRTDRSCSARRRVRL